MDDKENKLGLRDLYDALLLLPSMYEYKDKEVRRLARLVLCINDLEAVMDLLIFFSGRVLRVPDIRDIETTLKMISAYKDNMEKGIKPSSSSFYTALYKYNIKLTDENKEKFKKISRYFKEQRNKN